MLHHSHHASCGSLSSVHCNRSGRYEVCCERTTICYTIPVVQVEVITPEDHMGDVIGDLNSRRGLINKFEDKPGGMKVVQVRLTHINIHLYHIWSAGSYGARASWLEAHSQLQGAAAQPHVGMQVTTSHASTLPWCPVPCAGLSPSG